MTWLCGLNPHWGSEHSWILFVSILITIAVWEGRQRPQIAGHSGSTGLVRTTCLWSVSQKVFAKGKMFAFNGQAAHSSVININCLSKLTELQLWIQSISVWRETEDKGEIYFTQFYSQSKWGGRKAALLQECMTNVDISDGKTFQTFSSIWPTNTCSCFVVLNFLFYFEKATGFNFIPINFFCATRNK